MIKNRVKVMFVLFVFCCLIFSAVFASEVFANTCNSANDPLCDNASGNGGSTTGSGNWDTNYQAIRVSIYDKYGNIISGTHPCDYMLKGTKSENSSYTQRTKLDYLDNINPSREFCVVNDSLKGKNNGSDFSVMGETADMGALREYIENLGKDNLLALLAPTGYNINLLDEHHFIIVEPVTQLGGFWGTATDLVNNCTNSNCTNFSESNQTVPRVHLPYSIYVDKDDTFPDFVNSVLYKNSDGTQSGKIIGIDPDTSDGTTCSYYSSSPTRCYQTKDYVKNNGYGVGVFWFGGLGITNPKCDVNVNNNSNSAYNWTYWDANCDLDNDGIKDGCWKKQDNGCCEKETLTTDILNKYPQCASCSANTILDLGDDETTDIGRIECGKSNRIITNYRGSGDLDTATSNYCLANNNLYMGTINGKRYGCEIKDQLILPSKYTKKVAIGSYFVWPTSKTLQTLGNFSMQYPLNRVSSLWCVAYKYNTTGQLEYTTLTSAELNTLKARFNPTGNLSLLYEDNNNGNLVKEASSLITSASSDNSNFRIEIKNTYTLQKVSGTSGSYAYYDQENLAYTNTIVNNRINKYVQYGYPVIPFGKKGEKRVSITYGINFDDIDFSKLTSFSGSYICEKEDEDNDDGESIPCQCESGTLYEGLDLTPYFSSTYDSWVAECSRLRDLKCNDPNTDLVCPNDNTKVMNDCVNKKTYGGSTKEEAYNLCVANECNIDDEYDPPTCTGSDCKLDIIYRTIFLNDPFPGINYTDRLAGANWGGSKSLDRDGLGTKYITQTAEQMYQGDPMYSITLTPKAIKEIRDYNQDNGYDNFELSCDDNQYCTSTVLHNTFGKYLTGGTCQLQTNAKKRGNDGKGQDCRITALER